MYLFSLVQLQLNVRIWNHYKQPENYWRSHHPTHTTILYVTEFIQQHSTLIIFLSLICRKLIWHQRSKYCRYNFWYQSQGNARRTLEQSAELSVTPAVGLNCFLNCAILYSAIFVMRCHPRLVFNILNNFVHKWTFPYSVGCVWAISNRFW